MYKSIEEGLLEMVHFQSLCFISSIIGLLLMALGTVAFMCGFITWLKRGCPKGQIQRLYGQPLDP